MKVNIITRHAIANYGSILQSYATEKLFKNLGYDTEIINYIPEEEKTKNLINTYIKNSSFWNKNIITRKLYYIIQRKNINRMNNKFEEYRKEYLNITKKEFNNIKELKSNIPKADIYCTGSDQVWGKIGNQIYDKAYFLDFLPKKSKCISYAASFGTKKINEELNKNLPYLLSKYKNILVRENSALDIVKRSGFKNTNQVLDPTLMLSKEDWNNLCLNSKNKNPYILIYQLHHNKNFNKYAKKVKKKLGIELIRINTSKFFKFKPGKLICLPTPSEFLTYIKNAELVLTDSFHGTVFSIIFNKKFVDILPKKTGTRINSILELFGVEDRLLNDYNDLSIISKEIDFNRINNKLEKERKESKNRLIDALK